MRTKRTKHPYVYRVVYPKEKIDGYLAKVVRRSARLQKIFQLSKFKHDHRRCIKAASAAVSAFSEINPTLSRRELAELPKVKKDGDLPVGVRRVRKKVKSRFYHFYEASWSPAPNQQKTKRFSVDLYGEDVARDLALESRMSGLQAMVG
jgi:hypothetical protein